MEELERLRLKEGRLQAISNCAAQPFSGAKWKRWQDLRQELKVLLPRQAEVKAQRDHIRCDIFDTVHWHGRKRESRAHTPYARERRAIDIGRCTLYRKSMPRCIVFWCASCIGWDRILSAQLTHMNTPQSQMDAILERFGLVIAQQSIHFALQLNGIWQGDALRISTRAFERFTNPTYHFLLTVIRTS
jgi:hypothetical protein